MNLASLTKTTHSVLMSTAIFGIATLSSYAVADDADFRKLDGNGDGRISLREAVKDSTLIRQFDASDLNHDGMIAADEFENFKTVLTMKDTSTTMPVMH
ncbi:MAG: EF-hand domain-containing protein [Methylophilaceae bacterium]